MVATSSYLEAIKRTIVEFGQELEGIKKFHWDRDVAKPKIVV
jgi:hypothetical protein